MNSRWAQKQVGFTIVELLIVVVVIAILASITTVAYNGVTDRAYDTSVQNDLAVIARKYELYKTESSASAYPYGPTLNDGTAFKIGLSKNAYDTTSGYQLLNCTSTATPGSDYAILASSKSGKRFYISSTAGSVREYTGVETWVAVTNCPGVLPGSGGNGAGYSAGIWRAWTSTN